VSTVLNYAERAVVEHDQTAFNLAVWAKLTADPEFARLPYRLETDQHGQIIMSPPAAPSHGNKQYRIARLLGRLMVAGEVVTECPVSTRKGVKVIDVAWCSDGFWAESKDMVCLVRAPEICVEILSPSNTRGEIDEKRRLYFEAGAREVWLCGEDGLMSFFTTAGPVTASGLCAGFPPAIG
jgi:Uma2 family endonuclease